ncbi:MAG: glycosyltransferase family 39 protein, partial [Anaerolineae bacterium]
MKVPDKWFRYLLVLIAFAVRIFHITEQSIWRDEGVSFYLAASDIPAILADRASNVHPPLYFILLHFWTRFAGFSPLSGRFFSLFFGVLLVPASYFVARKVFGIRTALMTMAIVTFSPLYVVYSQETRVYSMLPLLYLFLIYRLYQLARGEGLRWRHWIELAVVEGLCLHLHYFSIFAVAYVNLFLAALWLKTREAISLRRWLSSQLLALLSSVPWAWMVIRSWMAKGLQQRYLDSYGSGYDPFELTATLWHFSNGGKDLRDYGLFTALSSLLAVALFATLVWSLRTDKRRRETLITLCHWIVPLILAFIVWWWRPLFHTRYILMFTVPLFVLQGQAIVTSLEMSRPAWLTGVSLAGALSATFVVGMGIAYFNAGYFKDDVRGMVQYLEPLSTADDVIIVHPLDYSIDYYYAGDANIAMIDTDTDEHEIASIEEAVRGKQKAFVAWPFGTLAGWRGLVPFWLELNGRLVDWERFRGYSLKIYELEQPINSPQVKPLAADFGDVRLTGAFYQREVEAGTAICLALRWRLAAAADTAYKTVVILWDEAGRRLSSADVLLVNEQSLSTDRWAPGEEVINYYIVPIPLGTPPLPYRISVGVYDAATLKRLDILDAGNPAGQDFTLGQTRLTKGRDFEHDPYGTRRQLSLEMVDRPEVAAGLALEGFAIDERQPARQISVTLRWRSLRDGLPRYIPRLRLRLRQDDDTLADIGSSLFEEQYPTTEWGRQELVFEQRELVYPPAAGHAVLEVETQGTVVRLAEVELEKTQLSFEVPPMQHQMGVNIGGFAELLGYDLDTTDVTAGDKVRLILYWRAINEEPPTTNYTVFTHLLSEDGKLIGQHDGMPAGGNRPTMSWAPGEVIVDVHEIESRDREYSGDAKVEIGLYDSITIQRISTEDGRDHIILPSQIAVKPSGNE